MVLNNRIYEKLSKEEKEEIYKNASSRSQK